MSWPGIKEDKAFHDKQKFQELKNEISNKIEEHFGQTLSSDWCLVYLSFEVLAIIDFDKIKKYGHCECCKNYKGVKSQYRKIYNIAILHSYCPTRNISMKHNDRCSWWEPANFYKQILENYINKVSQNYIRKNKFDDAPLWMESFYRKYFEGEMDFEGY